MELIAALAIVLALGIGAEWLAWILRLPSVLLLLAAGFLAGPVLGLINPDAVLGEALVPLVSVSVAIILFEGSLSLRLSHLRGTSPVVRRLLAAGTLATWLIVSLAAHLVFRFSLEVSVLLGAILVVTGPTVIVPLLLHLRPSGQSGPILRWEGILLDPIGAVLAVLVYEAIAAGRMETAGAAVAIALFRTVVFGAALGAAGTFLVVISLRRYWVPDYLHSPGALAVAVVVFAAANSLQADSGLLAVTVMGLALANQDAVQVAHIAQFKENLRVLLISALFVVLAARVDTAILLALAPASLLFVAILVLVARPAAVLVATLRSGLPLPERVFMAWLAPRGIVAASIASVFALRLEGLGYEDAWLIVPVTFTTIVGTVLVYGLTAAPVARKLGVAEARPQGILITGADPWIREIALALQGQGIKTVLVDSNWAHLSAARLSGLRAVYSSVVSHYALDELDLGGIGRLFAMGPIDEFNTLAVQHLWEPFGRREVYQLAPDTEGSPRARVSPKLSGRILFGPEWTFSAMARLFARGATVKVTSLTEEFDYDAFSAYYGDAAVLLFALDPSGRLQVYSEDSQPRARPGYCVVSVIDPDRPVPGEAR
jgi:NhaP-type Na+/H+ or K+/H+ antiporter